VTFKRQVRAAATCLCTIAIVSAAWAAADKGVLWSSLTPQQQQALAPLQRDWATLDANRRQKWLEVAGHFPGMPSDERKRVQERMAEWARLTPAERAQARMQFQEVRQLPPQERNAKWQAYQALPEEEKKSLAQRVQAPTKAASGADGKAKVRDALAPPRSTAVAASGPLTRSIGPIVVQARPGATTTTMSTHANVPAHRQPGAPKIAATAGYVDPATLLPRRSAPSARGADTPEQP
jgi:hypothetical protein